MRLFTIIVTLFLLIGVLYPENNGSAADNRMVQGSFFLIPHGTDKEPYEIEVMLKSLILHYYTPGDIVTMSGFNGRNFKKFSLQSVKKNISLPAGEIIETTVVESKFKKVEFQFPVSDFKLPAEADTLMEYTLETNVKIPFSKANAKGFEKFVIDTKTEALKNLLKTLVKKNYSKPYPSQISARVYFIGVPQEDVHNGIFSYKASVKCRFGGN